MWLCDLPKQLFEKSYCKKLIDLEPHILDGKIDDVDDQLFSTDLYLDILEDLEKDGGKWQLQFDQGFSLDTLDDNAVVEDNNDVSDVTKDEINSQTSNVEGSKHKLSTEATKHSDQKEKVNENNVLNDEKSQAEPGTTYVVQQDDENISLESTIEKIRKNWDTQMCSLICIDICKV